MRAIATLFKVFDYDGSGTVDQEEFLAVTRSLGMQPSEAEMAELMGGDEELDLVLFSHALTLTFM